MSNQTAAFLWRQLLESLQCSVIHDEDIASVSAANPSVKSEAAVVSVGVAKIKAAVVTPPDESVDKPLT